MSRKILVIADDVTAGLEFERALGSVAHEVRFCDQPAAVGSLAAEGGFELILLSQSHPQFDVLEALRQVLGTDAAASVAIVTRHPRIAAAVEAVKSGALDYFPEPDTPEKWQELLAQVQRAVEERTARPGDAVRLATGQGFEGMLGLCQPMREVFALIQRIAPADSTVLVSGESGTGKEMAARAIHRLSRRRGHPLLACDCTALAPTLLESELFGHVKGSFSGAIATKKGLFEVAHQGTLMLDEVANLSMETQGKLLRILETRCVRKVGDTVEHEVDIRLLATTNRSLAEMVKQGDFRADLYYRLNVVPIHLPPLRERPGDIPLLASAFLAQFARQYGVAAEGFCAEAMRQMEIYSWPGNVRELRNIVERLAVLYDGSQIGLRHLPSEIRSARPSVTPAAVPETWEEFRKLKRQVVDELERRFLTAALNRCSQNVTQAAESVGIARPNFHALLRAHGLRPGTPEK